jgi:hypothetical protein
MKPRNLELMDEGYKGKMAPVKKKKFKERPELGPMKSWNEQGIPSDRVAPGAPNPPPRMMSPAPARWVKKKKSAKMRHGQY